MANLPRMEMAGTLPDRLVVVLEQAIIDGTFEPGEHLNAEDLAQHFAVSRIPVREALRTLHARGWVRIEPRHGAYVRQRSRGELEDVFETRLLLEDHAARLAARRRTDAQLERLDELVAAGREAARNDPTSIGHLNSEFHRALAACTDNAVLTDLLRTLSQRVRWYYSAVSDRRGPASMEEHQHIVAAIRRRDEDEAARLIRQHIEATSAALADIVPHGR